MYNIRMGSKDSFGAPPASSPAEPRWHPLLRSAWTSSSPTSATFACECVLSLYDNAYVCVFSVLAYRAC